MSSYVQNILQDAIGDGARATKFECDIVFTNPSLADALTTSTIIKATTFPSRTHSKIDLLYKGRTIPIKGQVKYNQTWTATFYLAEDHKLKNSFEIWIEALDQKHNYNEDMARLRNTQGYHANNGYTTEIKMYQKNFDGDQTTAEYVLHNAFPVEISELEYNAESVGQIQEFTVTFTYSHFTIKTMKQPDGTFVDEQIGKVQDTIQDGVNTIIAATGGAIEKITNPVLKNQTKEDEKKQDIVSPSNMFSSIWDLWR